VDEAALFESRLVQKRGASIKVLGNGELKKKLTVSAHQFSGSAREKIETAGGTVVVLPGIEKKEEQSSAS
jgi:large subunit ribosomal protein L15